MIKLYDGAQINERKSITSVQFKALYELYGQCGEVLFWTFDSLIMYYMGGTVHIDGDCADIEELIAFLDFVGGKKIYAPKKLGNALGYKCEKTVYEAEIFKPDCPKTNEGDELKLDLIYDILSKSGGELDLPPFDSFAVDFSHRVRHGRGRYFGNEKGVAIITAETEKYAVLGGIGVLPQYRGKSAGSAILSSVCANLNNEGKTVLTATTKAVLPFYLKNGFKVYNEYGIFCRS